MLTMRARVKLNLFLKHMHPELMVVALLLISLVSTKRMLGKCLGLHEAHKESIDVGKRSLVSAQA